MADGIWLMVDGLSIDPMPLAFSREPFSRYTPRHRGGSMKRPLSVCAVVALLVVSARGQGGAPSLQVNPLWPQPLPNHWVFGSITGVAVDAQDHVWVVHRGADSLEGNEKGMMATPQTSVNCCTAAPFILEFDTDGKLPANFGGPGQGYQWPVSPGGIAVDAEGNVG